MVSSETRADALDIPFVHPSALVERGAALGARTRIWHRAHIREGSRIGSDCNIGFGVYVDTDVLIGDRCKIQNHVSVYRGVSLDDEVFVGPSAAFTNDLYPRAISDDWEVVPTHVGRGASIGANATVVCGSEIGDWAMIAAGAIVTSDVPAHGLIVGAPGRVRGWVCRCGLPFSAGALGAPMRCARCGRTLDDLAHLRVAT